MSVCAPPTLRSYRWMVLAGTLLAILGPAINFRGNGGRCLAAEWPVAGQWMQTPGSQVYSPAPSQVVDLPGQAVEGDVPAPSEPAGAASMPAASTTADQQLDLPVETERRLQESCPPGACPDSARCWDVGLLVRGYYLNDQRIEWSGVEATFAAEGIIAPVIRHNLGSWQICVEGEFYLNQPFDRNVLIDTAERRSYLANWEVETFEISKLSVCLQRDAWSLAVGKMETPFGRYYEPLFTNARIDAPFIRTESILWRETGVLLRYQPGWLVGDVALTNGCEDGDTNSSKALMSRIGLESDVCALGCSIKVQDGIGSESQKEYKNHLGVDAMVRFGRCVLSAEAIYDEYGFHRPGFDPDEITWERSIYYRDLNLAYKKPISGIGYYASLGYFGERWRTVLNYGEYYPSQIGVPQHDETNRRGIVKAGYAVTRHLETYGVVMVENGGWVAQDSRPRIGRAVLTGIQYFF